MAQYIIDCQGDQWTVDVEANGGGWKATKPGFETGTYVNYEAAKRAVDLGNIRVVSDLPATRSGEGLVYNQQSLGAGKAPSEGLSNGQQSVGSNLSPYGPRGGPGDRTAPSSGRWRVLLSSGTDTLSIDTHQARLSRCQQRVHAWATALPRLNRKARRAGKKLDIGPRMVMLTLTYKDADMWESNQIRDFMTSMRNLLGKQLYGYAWVLEMQERGAPHYHVLLYVSRGTRIPKPDERLWEYGMSRIETVKTPFYICKYTSKGHQKAYQKEGLPAGARMFAVKIYDTNLPEVDLFTFAISSAPSWLRPHLLEAFQNAGSVVHWNRVKGGGWLIRETGEVLQSPWKIIAVERIGGP